jgi:hypothetical protein
MVLVMKKWMMNSLMRKLLPKRRPKKRRFKIPQRNLYSARKR